MNTVKFSVFADLHYCPDVFYSKAEEKLTAIQQRALENKVDFIIHAGDFCHGPAPHMAMVNRYLDFEIPSYSCLGNHDSDQTSLAETLAAYRMPNDYYYFDCKGFRMVVMNLNYFIKDGEYLRFDRANYRDYGARGVMPPHELEWLGETLDSSPYPCILISHQSIERGPDGAKNAAEIRAVIDEANRKSPRKVMLVINGHYHKDFIRLLNNVVYLDLNSTAYDWLDKEHHLYPKELEEQYCLIQNTICVNEPIHAVVTLTDEGEVKIEGMEGSYLNGVTKEMTDEPDFDPSGRPYRPRVSSAHIKLL